MLLRSLFTFLYFEYRIQHFHWYKVQAAFTSVVKIFLDFRMDISTDRFRILEEEGWFIRINAFNGFHDTLSDLKLVKTLHAIIPIIHDVECQSFSSFITKLINIQHTCIMANFPCPRRKQDQHDQKVAPLDFTRIFISLSA